MRRYLATTLEIAVPIALLVLWGVWSASGDTFYFPPLTDILQKFQELWLFDRVGSDVVPSLERLFLGYAIACVVAVAIGIPLGLSPLLRRATSPIVEFLRAIPPPALLPFAVVVLGVGNAGKVFLIAFVLATISEITIRISASDRLVRMPAKICGLAAGSTIRSTRSRPETP
jgi:ABC-type nitrate/sulfonate/bicarbonate transport system permease component